MTKSIEIKNNKVTNIAIGEVAGWVQVGRGVNVNIGDTATNIAKGWTFTPPVIPQPNRTWWEKRQHAYRQKSEYEQIEMMADGTFNAWYQAIKNKYPKPKE